MDMGVLVRPVAVIVVVLKRKGAPIDYVPVQPVVARPQGIGIARNAPHPNAAQLFADYVLSPEGQTLFESMGRVPASTKVKSAFNNFPFILIDPVTVLDESAKWEKRPVTAAMNLRTSTSTF